jgi:tRNA-2-methylthio-N6-dimethylallyladenosine synthase
MPDTVPDDIKAERLQRLMNAQRDRQRVSYERHMGQVMDVMVEGYNTQRGQVTGRSSQNKTVNFTTTQPILPAIGSYLNVRITKTFPNSLVGEAVIAG